MQEAVKLQLCTYKEEESFWIGVIFINHRIRARVYNSDTFSNLMQRVRPFKLYVQLTFVLGIEPEYSLGLKLYDSQNQQGPKESSKEEKKRGKK